MDRYDAIYNELKQYKELLDLGILTQEEFDIRKKELLKYVIKQTSDPEPVKEPEQVKEPEPVEEPEPETSTNNDDLIRENTEADLTPEINDNKGVEEKEKTEEQSKEIKPKKRKKKGLKTIAITVIVLLLIAGAAFAARMYTYHLADSGEFEKASSLKVFTAGDDNFIDYVESGINYNNKEYKKAIEGFEALGDYRESEQFKRDCYYQYGCAEYEKKNYIDAIMAFSEIPDYKDSSDYLESLKAEAYELAVQYFSSGDYSKALGLFELTDEKDSEKYRTVIGVIRRNLKVEALRNIIDFEPAKEAVFINDIYEDNTVNFLLGTWKTADKSDYFMLTGSVGNWTAEWSLPSNDQGDYAVFVNNTICDDLENGKVPFFEFTIVNWNQIKIKSLENGVTYTLYRQ